MLEVNQMKNVRRLTPYFISTYFLIYKDVNLRVIKVKDMTREDFIEQNELVVIK